MKNEAPSNSKLEKKVTIKEPTQNKQDLKSKNEDQKNQAQKEEEVKRSPEVKEIKPELPSI